MFSLILILMIFLIQFDVYRFRFRQIPSEQLTIVGRITPTCLFVSIWMICVCRNSVVFIRFVRKIIIFFLSTVMGNVKNIQIINKRHIQRHFLFWHINHFFYLTFRTCQYCSDSIVLLCFVGSNLTNKSIVNLNNWKVFQDRPWNMGNDVNRFDCHLDDLFKV